MVRSKEITRREEHTKPLKLYWIYRKDGYFLGGNPCPVGKEHFADQELEWRSKKNPGAYLEWQPGTFTYKEAYVVARMKCEAVQRDQPGVRENYDNPGLFRAIALVADLGEIVVVRGARTRDAYERKQLGTNDQKKLDEYRSQRKQISGK